METSSIRPDSELRREHAQARGDFYRTQALEMLERARATQLPQVRDNYLRAATRWTVLREREQEVVRRP